MARPGGNPDLAKHRPKGRAPGQKNKTTQAREEAEAAAIDALRLRFQGCADEALDTLLKAMREADHPTAVQAADKVLSRVLPSLKAIDNSFSGPLPTLRIDMRSAARKAKDGE